MSRTFPSAQTSWSPALVIDIAINETSLNGPLMSTEDLCERYGLSEDEFAELKQLSAFKKDVREAIVEVKQNGLTPKKKMAIMYEYVMDTLMPEWLTNPDFPATEKVKIFVHLGKGSGLVVDKPVEDKKDQVNLQMPTLNIILTQEQPKPITILPPDSYTTIEQS